MLIGHCYGTDKFNSKTRMPEARVVLKEYTHACPVGKLMPSMIRFRNALLNPLKQLQIIRGQGGVKSHARQFILKTLSYSESCEGDSELCTI